jgi:hypothetical protein
MCACHRRGCNERRYCKPRSGCAPGLSPSRWTPRFTPASQRSVTPASRSWERCGSACRHMLWMRAGDGTGCIGSELLRGPESLSISLSLSLSLCVAPLIPAAALHAEVLEPQLYQLVVTVVF